MKTASARRNAAKLRYPWLFALPDGELPRTVKCAGGTYELVQVFKHDFFAATGLYSGSEGLAVLKLGRTNPLLTLPMDWAGRFLARRELRLYEQLREVPGVPRVIGPAGKTGFMHVYVPGHPLGRREQVSDAFFDQLAALLNALHARHIAYVDLNKRENILVGDDGRPYLIDFQISLWLPPIGWRAGWPVQWILRRFQDADRYHFLKHKRRLRPDLLTPTERQAAARVGGWIRLHRWLTRPLTELRRRVLRRLRAAETRPVAGSSAR